MNPNIELASPENIAAFIALAKYGNIRKASEMLFITEQGTRNRLIAIEKQLGVELYHKGRGRRQRTPLTEDGRKFLPHARAFLEQSTDLLNIFASQNEPQEVRIAASAYLTCYVLIDAIKDFHAAFPDIRIRLSTRAEQEIEQTLIDDPYIELGFAAPYEPATELEYSHTFAMDWSLLTPPKHPLLKKTRLRLQDITHEPLILFEHGSTGRQHILDAFGERGLNPRIEMEATNTPIITRMVESGLGVSIVPLLSNGAVTRNTKVGVVSLGKQIRPILSGILRRRHETLSPAAECFMTYIQKHGSVV